jgi:predicted esterase
MAQFLLTRRCFSTAAALLLSNGVVHAFGSKAWICSNHHRHYPQSSSHHLVSRQMSSTDSTNETGASEPSSSRLRVLLLHGSGGTADGFAATMQHWREAIMAAPQNIDLEFTAIQAHVEKENGYAWWSMPPGVRSFTAESYDGFEISTEKVLQTMQQQDPPFDLVVGHSQGAILTTALLALDKIPQHPRGGYILNGVAWPNPYTREFQALRMAGGAAPRVLMIVGANDQMNPPEQAMRVRAALEQAGCALTVVSHQGGHSVPTEKYETLETILQWIGKSL